MPSLECSPSRGFAAFLPSCIEWVSEGLTVSCHEIAMIAMTIISATQNWTFVNRLAKPFAISPKTCANFYHWMDFCEKRLKPRPLQILRIICDASEKDSEDYLRGPNSCLYRLNRAISGVVSPLGSLFIFKDCLWEYSCLHHLCKTY